MEKNDNRFHEKTFNTRDEVKNEVRTCGKTGGIILDIGIIFAIIGVIAGLFDTTIGLDSMSWLLLAIFFALNALICYVHSVIGKHMYGIESEIKK